jgi:hypothetical protein
MGIEPSSVKFRWMIAGAALAAALTLLLWRFRQDRTR